MLFPIKLLVCYCYWFSDFLLWLFSPGWLFDSTGSYTRTFYSAGAALILGGVICIPIRKINQCIDPSKISKQNLDKPQTDKLSIILSVIEVEDADKKGEKKKSSDLQKGGEMGKSRLAEEWMWFWRLVKGFLNDQTKLESPKQEAQRHWCSVYKFFTAFHGNDSPSKTSSDISHEPLWLWHFAQYIFLL